MEHQTNNAGRVDATARSASEDTRDSAPEPVPSSNTGRKNETPLPELCPESQSKYEGGERIEFVSVAGQARAEITPLPNDSSPADVALIDWLSFTVLPPEDIARIAKTQGFEDAGYRWLLNSIDAIFGIAPETLEQKRGINGFKYSADFPGGFIAWGGASQRGRVMLNLSGQGCAKISDWAAVRTWLEFHHAKLTRVDLAHDDFTGETLNIEQFVQWYQEGGFDCGGRKPRHETSGDWLNGPDSVKGRTLYVGARENGKLFRGYEKGKQLGDPNGRWVRAECEWGNKSRVLPYEMLTKPGQYLAGAYPCLKFLNATQCKIKTTHRAAKLEFDRALDHVRRQSGKTINLALMVSGGDYVAVLERLRREGIPARIEPYSYYIDPMPSVLDDDQLAEPTAPTK